MEPEQARELFKGYLYRRYGDRSTPKHYLSDLRIFLAQIGDKPIKEVTAQDIDRFVDQQHAQNLAPATINRRLATLRTFFECLACQVPDDVWPNPVNWRRHGVRTGKALPRDALDPEVECLFAVMDDKRDAAIFGLMVGAGLRVGEVINLHISDLESTDSVEQMVRLRVTGKGQKERTVWLTPIWYAKVREWLVVRPATEDEHLFLNQHGRGLSKDGVQYRLRHYCQVAGVSITCHQLRHTFARRLAEQRMPIESISRLLGHTYVATTQRYTAGANPDLRDEFCKVMAQLEGQKRAPAVIPQRDTLAFSRSPRQEGKADPAKLKQGLQRYQGFSDWLRQELCAYTQYRWRSWKPHMAGKHVTRLTCQLTNTWMRLFTQRTILGWADLQRSDLEI